MRGSKHSGQAVNQSIVHHDLFQSDWNSLVTMKVVYFKHKKKKERKKTHFNLLQYLLVSKVSFSYHHFYQDSK